MGDIRVHPSAKYINRFSIEKGKPGGYAGWNLNYMYVQDRDIPSLVSAIEAYLADFAGRGDYVGEHRYNGGVVKRSSGSTVIIIDEKYHHTLTANPSELREIKLKLLGALL